MNNAKIEQQVSCAFGKDHKVYLDLSDGAIKSITCTCYNEKKEVEGMIALGTPSEKTCFGVMNQFLQACKDGRSYYRYNSVLSNLILGDLIGTVGSSTRKKRDERAELKTQTTLLVEAEGAVERGLRKLIKDQVGEVEKRYAIMRSPSSGEYVFTMIKDKVQYWDSSSQKYITPTDGKVEIANRKEGKWELVPDWKTKILSSFSGRDCPWCNTGGVYKHSSTKTHIKNIERITVIALQATSAPGMKKVKKNTKDGVPHKLRYKIGSNKALGVIFPYEPEEATNTMENENDQ